MKQYKERQGKIDVAAVLDNPHCFEIRIFKHYEDVGAKEYTKLRNTRILPLNFFIIHSRTDRRSDLKPIQTKHVISAINSEKEIRNIASLRFPKYTDLCGHVVVLQRTATIVYNAHTQRLMKHFSLPLQSSFA